MRIGVIGCGVMGQRRVADLLALQETHLMVYDPDLSRAESLAEYARVATSVDAFWRWRPEAVLICTPPACHLDDAATARLVGVPAIYIEKPLALTLPPVGELKASERFVTQVGANWRWHAGPSVVKSWLSAGLIGSPHKAEFHAGYYLPDIRPDWRACYVKDTGACLDIGWHLVDLALDWFGPATLDESHLWACRDVWPDTDAQAVLYLKHDSGVESQVSVDLFQAEPDHYATVNGLLGKAGYSLRHRKASWARTDALAEESVDLEADDGAMMKAELAHFLECARAGRETVNPVGRAAATLGLLLEAKARWRLT